MGLIRWLLLFLVGLRAFGAAQPPGDTILPRLMQAISRHENCRQWRNPGCLAYARQKGAYRTASGYASFRTWEDGRLALERDLILKLRSGMTVRQVMLAWNGGKYLAALLKETGLRAGDRWNAGHKANDEP